MAGTIEFGDGSSWESSGGTFRDMAAGVLSHLPEGDPIAGRINSVFDMAIESGLMFVLFNRDLDPEMQAMFAGALQAHLTDPRTSDPKLAWNPELVAGYMARLSELCQLVQINARAKVPGG